MQQHKGASSPAVASAQSRIAFGKEGIKGRKEPRGNVETAHNLAGRGHWGSNV